MKFVIITLFPEIFEGVLGSSIIGRAQEKGLVDFEFVNLRNFGIGPRKQVDDTPYGGGAGMVLRVDVMAAAIQVAKKIVQCPTSSLSSLVANPGISSGPVGGDPRIRKDDIGSEKRKLKIILMTPQGERLIQPKLRKMADFGGDYIILCGHYEGFDERIREFADVEISIGDFVVTGGELPAMLLVDGITRLIPGVLGSEASHQDETHSEHGRIEYPHFTRPEYWEGKKVPQILLSGNHGEIAKWREQQSTKKSDR